MPLLDLRDVRKAYVGDGRVTEAIADVSLTVARGSFVSLVGPSGCGKSTLLQIVAGLLPASGGSVLLDGRPVTAPPYEAVYVFQQYTKSIFPWKSVLSNVMFGIANRRVEGRRLPRAEVRARCEEMLRLVGLGDFMQYMPYQLSGGMQQRLAIARALVCRPEVLLMDEPFSAVDALTRVELQDLLLRLWADFRPTVVFVTHDIDEAIYLSQRVVVLTRAPARISQIVDVDLPWPRDQIGTRELPHYLECRRRVLEDISSSRARSEHALPAALGG